MAGLGIGGFPGGGGFLPNPNPGGGGLGGGGLDTNIPVSTTPGGTTTRTPASSTVGQQIGQGIVQGLANVVGLGTSNQCGIGDFLLRMAFFILGLVAVVGAIYLYKGSNPVLALPAAAAKGTVKLATHAVKAAAAAAAEGGE